MKKYLNAYKFLFPIAALIATLDQWTKSFIRSNMDYGTSWMPWEWLSPYARIVHWSNTGAAFGMAQGYSIFFTILAFVVVLLIIYYFPQIPAGDFFLRLALAMQLGGAIGNLIDRLAHDGHVTDFISVGTFPVFNVADSFITVGAGVLLIGIWLEERKTPRKKAKTQESLNE